MGAEVIVNGLVSTNPISVIPPTIPGLVVWAYFGSIFSSDNTNLAPSGAAFANVGTGPESIESNYIRCWYQAGIRSGWQRYSDGSDGPVTIVTIGRTTGNAAGSQFLCGDGRLFVSAKEIEIANGSVPSVSSIRAGTASPYLTVPTTRAWRAYAITEPAAGVSGTSYVMDLTADAEATTVQNGVSSNPDAGNYVSFGVALNAGTGARRMEVAAAVVTPAFICAACKTSEYSPSAMQPGFCFECVHAMLKGRANRLECASTPRCECGWADTCECQDSPDRRTTSDDVIIAVLAKALPMSPTYC